MNSVELAELAIDLRLKYKLDTELKWENKYPLNVFRSRHAEAVVVKYDSILKTYNLGIVKAHPANTPDIEEYTEYVKGLSRNEAIVKIVKTLGM